MVTHALGAVSGALSGARSRTESRCVSSRRRVRPYRVLKASVSDVANPDVAADPGPSGRPIELPRCVGTVTHVDKRDRRFEFYVIGTVHTPGCASADEVTSVIERVRPHAVVLELDQERLDITVANAMVATAPEYGADFLAGAVAAEKIGALVVLGDAKARSLPELARARLFTSPKDLFDLPRLWRSLKYLSEALGFGGESNRTNQGYKAVKFAQALASDPGKLLPLRGPAVIGALALLATAHDAAAVPEALTRAAPLASLQLTAMNFFSLVTPSPADVIVTLLTTIVAGRATEVLLESRDDILAQSAARAASMIAGIDDGKLKRVEHGFTADSDATRMLSTSETDSSSATTFPCFTLWRPLQTGETRRLNLFEPRWLAMIDALAAKRGGDAVGGAIACGLAVNRRYVNKAWLMDARRGGGGVESGVKSALDGSDTSLTSEKALQSERNADLVVQQFARVAKVVAVNEGTRAVTRARKLEVFLEGGGELRQVETFKPHPAGYMRVTLGSTSGIEAVDQRESSEKKKTMRIVCVVGLAHCNGVLSRLAAANVEEAR